ncbi:MAG TPA: hypothetical protein ENL35_02150 [Chloroflexi bacterium]|nr:hypothetical protein [Chloroflexota bacterium]
MVTRESELLRILGALAQEFPQLEWVALVDDDGLMIACHPASPPVSQDRIAGMTAAQVLTSRRLAEEMEAGKLRYVTVMGSAAQILIVALDRRHFLTLGMAPQVQSQGAFGPLSRWVPELLRTLRMRFSAT